jgi:plasmid stabilization system protein ParE
VKPARFVAAARAELLAEIAYSADADPNLGRRCVQAVEAAVARAVAFPAAGSPARSNTRRVLIRGFPFAVYYRAYRAEIDGIVVFAIAHHARQPGYWTSRADDA